MSKRHGTIPMTIHTKVVQLYPKLLTWQVIWENTYQALHHITDSSQNQEERRLQVPCIINIEPPTYRKEDIKMEPKSKYGTISRSITKTRKIIFHDYQPGNGYGFTVIKWPTQQLLYVPQCIESISLYHDISKCAYTGLLVIHPPYLNPVGMW